MTIIKNYKEYILNGVKYFVEQYKGKYENVWLWRYGYLVDAGSVHYGVLLRKGLLSRPNLKRLFGN